MNGLIASRRMRSLLLAIVTAGVLAAPVRQNESESTAEIDYLAGLSHVRS